MTQEVHSSLPGAPEIPKGLIWQGSLGRGRDRVPWRLRSHHLEAGLGASDSWWLSHEGSFEDLAWTSTAFMVASIFEKEDRPCYQISSS